MTNVTVIDLTESEELTLKSTLMVNKEEPDSPRVVMLELEEQGGKARFVLSLWDKQAEHLAKILTNTLDAKASPAEGGGGPTIQ